MTEPKNPPVIVTVAGKVASEAAWLGAVAWLILALQDFSDLLESRTFAGVIINGLTLVFAIAVTVYLVRRGRRWRRP